MRRLALVASAGFAGLAITAAPALGDAFVDRQTFTIVYRGDGGAEAMSVTGSGDSVTMTANVTIDVSVEDQDPGECTGDDTMVVTCDATDYTALSIQGGPLNTSVSGNDTITVTSLAADMNNVDIFGEDANDVLTGSPIADTIDGGSGDDELNGAGGGDILQGGANASAPPDTDTLNGGENDDTLENSTGPDTYNGGNGTDEVNYSVTPGSANIFAQIPSSPGGAGPGCPATCDGDTIGGDIENLTGDGGDDAFIGSQSSTVPNELSGLGGNDNLRGGSAPGNDGADHFFGGSGTDVANYTLQTGDLVVDIGGGADDPNGDNVEDSIEELRGGQGDDTLTGDDDAVTGDTLNGGFGDDVLQGSPGTGADASDAFVGGEFSEDEGGDTVTYAPRTSGVTATIGNGPNDGAGGENDNVQGEIENLTGGTVGDTLVGDDTANRLLGGGGDDTLRGGAETGPDGADNFDGGTQGAQGDTVSYFGRTDGVFVIIGVGTLGGSEGDVINPNIDNLIGSSGADGLSGDADANRLDGGDGGDVLNGDFGNDAPDAGDVFVGGANAAVGDTVTYVNRDDDVTADIGGGANDGGGDDVQVDVENLTGGIGDDTLSGDGDGNLLDGGDGDDALFGNRLAAPQDGPDIFVGGNHGSAGGAHGTLGDLVTYFNRSDPIVASIGGGPNDGGGGCPAGAGCEHDDIRDDVERLTGGTSGDTLTGNAAANRIEGENGGDTITGGAGADSLLGEGGIDTLLARDGEDDTIDCGTEMPDVAELDLLTLDDPATGCETVNRAQFVPPSTGGGQTPAATENPECAALRAKLKKLNRRIKQADDPDQKAKLKKKRRKVRKQLAALGC